MITMKCDFCKKEIKVNEEYYYLQTQRFLSDGRSSIINRLDEDIDSMCNDCRNKINITK